jgi:predicted O-methyltransferase YrrM
VSSILRDPAVAAVLSRLRAQSDAEDPPAKARVQARERALGQNLYGEERVELYAGAPLAIAAEVGELLYVLALARRARTIVEFGASVGYSTVHLAAGLRDADGGLLITTELSADKARDAVANLAEAQLDDLVEMRVGDARETLLELPDTVDLLFLDGWNDLYEQVLDVVAPRLPAGAFVVADLSKGHAALERYRERMLDPASGFASVELALDDGVLLSARV